MDRGVNFTKQMKSSTRDVHKISDALINAKLAFALSDNNVWADGLLVFYEIFKYLEENVPEQMLPVEFHRKDAFENDLEFYLGTDWKNTANLGRLSVTRYLDHLETIQRTNPILLVAYVYHLYMGLLSGGQILQKKRQIANKINIFQANNLPVNGGYAVTDFGNKTIRELKEQMRTLVNELAVDWDDQVKGDILSESRDVFKWNNEIVNSVRGVNAVTLHKVGLMAVVSILLYFMFQWIRT